MLKVVESLRKQSQEVGTDFAKIEQVATISANNDETIGKLIAEAMGKVNKEGVITVEEPKAPRPTWRWSRACSSTAVISRPTS